MEEQRESARRRVAEADERIGELTANYEALGLRDTLRSAELMKLAAELAQSREENFTRIAELTAKLAAEQNVAERNWEDRCRIQAELLSAIARGEQVAKESDAAHRQVAHLESALRQRQEETEQTHKALGEARGREADLKRALATGAEREATLVAHLARSEDCILRLSAQRYAARADASSARSQVDKLSVDLCQARDDFEFLRGEMENRLDAVRSEAQAAKASAILAENVANERSEEISRLSDALNHRESQTAELDRVLGGMRLDLSKHLIEKSELADKLAATQLEAEKHLATAEWLRLVHASLASAPFWWQLLPASWRRDRENRRLQRDGLFDQHEGATRFSGTNPAR